MDVFAYTRFVIIEQLCVKVVLPIVLFMIKFHFVFQRYAAQMRQSAVYLHQTPQHHQQQRNQSLSRATTPSKSNSHRVDDADSNNSGSIAEVPCPAVRKSQREYSHRQQHPMTTQSLQRYTE